MKTKIITLLSIFVLSIMPAVAQQKYACVNTDYVLRCIPDYANAQKRIDKYVADLQKELTDKQSEIEELRAEYEQESYLLPDNLKKRRQEEIKLKEQELRSLQQQRFGVGGDLDKKRAELLKPVQDRVYAAIERIAQEKNYAFVFDKAGSPAVLFANKKFDISDDVLESLGYKPGGASVPAVVEETKKKPTNPEMRQRDGDRQMNRDSKDLKPKKL
jgi:outer membrane protein